MDPDLVIKVIGVAASAAVPIGVSLFTHPRRRVSYFIEQRAASNEAGKANLNLVTVNVWASGRNDIPSTAFDGQKSIVFQFNSPIVDGVVPPDEGHVPGWGFERAGENQVSLAPTLLGRRDVLSTTIAVSSPVRFWIKHPLLDIPVVRETSLPTPKASTRVRRAFRVTGLSAGIALTVLGIILFNVSIAFVTNPDLTVVFAALSFVGSLFSTTGLIMVVVSLIVRLIRWIIQRRSQPSTTASTEVPPSEAL